MFDFVFFIHSFSYFRSFQKEDTEEAFQTRAPSTLGNEIVSMFVSELLLEKHIGPSNFFHLLQYFSGRGEDETDSRDITGSWTQVACFLDSSDIVLPPKLRHH